MIRAFFKPFLLSGAIMTAAAFVHAGEIKNLTGHQPDANEIINALSPNPDGPKLKYRGLKVATEPVDARERENPTIALNVTFEFNSAELNTESMKVLDELGQALASDQLSEFRFMLEGHTDSVGDEDYNMYLSKLRADAVMAYLSENFNLPSEKLVAVGRGENFPLSPEDTRSGVNRRVQIMNLGN